MEETIDQIIDSLWFRYDENGDGELELEEAHNFFSDVLRESGLHANKKIEESSVKEMFSDFDLDKNNKISKKEMRRSIGKLIGLRCL